MSVGSSGSLPRPTETVHIPAARDYFEDFKTWLSRARPGADDSRILHVFGITSCVQDLHFLTGHRRCILTNQWHVIPSLQAPSRADMSSDESLVHISVFTGVHHQ